MLIRQITILKITEIEGKISSISGLAKTSTLTVVDNKIPNVSNLVKKKQIMTQNLLRLKKNLPIIITILMNILLLQSLKI